MQRRSLTTLLACFLLGLALAAPAQEHVRIMTGQAAGHAGEFAEVCGVIVDTNYARRSRGSPTYLNFSQPYPDHDFTVIVWGKDRKHFDVKPETLKDHKACVFGKVELYKGKPQIVVVRPEQIASAPARAEGADTGEEQP